MELTGKLFVLIIEINKKTQKATVLYAKSLAKRVTELRVMCFGIEQAL